ncbi:KilA-N domain-containing protein [Pseudomonas sp. TH49]|uniref:KilA-N domain-containing protein n=1 Tax=Pseudomonas sp. TH49 TaxID=2796413 RepID=UPI001912F226|nr:KilA-N domain-containing protein [Pseudomonas sp. TH49]MBK5343207.1 KilA-N domain-containing protein [Pseudomonas sp. TH49]
MSNVANLSDYQTQEVVIDGITVKQDAEGRYCLNDVHKASGGEATKAPAQWMRHDVFHEFVEEIVRLSTINPVESKRGRTGGTFAVKELVYAYAMWISPSYYTNGNGSTQFAEYKLTSQDFEKIADRLTDKELNIVRRYFGVKPTAEVAEPEATTPAKVTEVVEVADHGETLTMSSLEI